MTFSLAVSAVAAFPHTKKLLNKTNISKVVQYFFRLMTLFKIILRVFLGSWMHSVRNYSANSHKNERKDQLLACSLSF